MTDGNVDFKSRKMLHDPEAWSVYRNITSGLRIDLS